MDERIEGYLRLMDLDPENSIYYVPLSKFYVEKGDEEKAIDLLETATEKTDDPDVEQELEKLRKPVSKRMRLKGKIINNSEEHGAKWKQIREDHPAQFIGISSLGVRFSQPVSVVLNNKNFEIQEAGIWSSEEFNSALIDENGNVDPIVGKEINLVGYFGISGRIHGGW